MTTDALSKFGACLCFICALALVPACGPSGNSGKDDNNDDANGGTNGTLTCADDETKAEVNGELGCFSGCDDGECTSDATCRQGLCIPNDTSNDTGSNNTANNTDPNNTPNNTDPNNTTNNSNNTTNNTNNTNTDPDPALVAKCEDAADLLYGMCYDECTLDAELEMILDNAYDSFLNGDGTAENPSCAQFAADNPSFETDLDEFLAANNCDTLKPQRCGQFGLTEECGCAAPDNVGAACTEDDMCDSGDIDSFCATEDDTGFPGGYCIAAPCPAINPDLDGDGQPDPNFPQGWGYPSDVCGGDICRTFVNDMGSAQGLCFAGCDADDCRDGYACNFSNLRAGENEGDVEAVRICTPACSSNDDCPGSQRCNITGTGACEFQCDGTPGPNGEPSVADLCASAGGTCTIDTNDDLEYCVF